MAPGCDGLHSASKRRIAPTGSSALEPLSVPILVLWWVPAGHLPTVEEAKERLATLEANGPTAEAFTFRHPFPAPGEPARPAPEVDAEFCAPAG